METGDKLTQLKVAIEITKEFGRGGYSSTLNPDEILELLYKKLIELKEEALK